MPSGSAMPKNWFSVSQTTTSPWVRAAQFFGQFDESTIRQTAHRAAQPMVEHMRSRINDGPDTNGTINPDLDFRDVAGKLKTWDEVDNVYVGVPTEDPLSDRASWMELGDEDVPPSPVLHGALHDAGLRRQVVGRFMHGLANPQT